jgi:hypothetical protein
MRSSCNQVRDNVSRFPSGLECKPSTDRSAESQSWEALVCVTVSVGSALGEGGTRRRDNNPCSSFSTAEKTKEPSGFCVAKARPVALD